MTTCTICSGSGAIGCPRCIGEGGFSDPFTGYETCRNCEGRGEVQCTSCLGMSEPQNAPVAETSPEMPMLPEG